MTPTSKSVWTGEGGGTVCAWPVPTFRTLRARHRRLGESSKRLGQQGSASRGSPQEKLASISVKTDHFVLHLHYSMATSLAQILIREFVRICAGLIIICFAAWLLVFGHSKHALDRVEVLHFVHCFRLQKASFVHSFQA